MPFLHPKIKLQNAVSEHSKHIPGYVEESWAGAAFLQGQVKWVKGATGTLSVFLTPNNVVVYKYDTGKHVCLHSSGKGDPCT